MRFLGELSLLVALVGSGYAAFACLLAAVPRWQHLRRVGIAAAGASLTALTLTVCILGWALVVRDFGFYYVAQYTSRLLPWHYSLSALWVGQAGSLLLWAWMLAVLAMIFWISAPRAVSARRRFDAVDERWATTVATGSGAHRTKLRDCAFGILMANVCFLVAIMMFAADPMKASLAVRSEGLGLSPLLQHPSMLIHPPVVFLAYAAWTVPFSLAVASLVTGEVNKAWINAARPWALLAWTILGAGLLLGANWAYQELGWGGYWGWDPVENGSLMPWLTGTALIHCMLAWRHRGCLKKMTISLAIVTFGLCNFATFLTRSGVFSSVHAFSESPIGWMFLGLMAVLLVGGTVLVLRRRGQLAPARSLQDQSLFARESLVLISVGLLLVLTGVIIVGTSCVPLSTMLIGRTAQIGPAYYNNVLMPIGIVLMAATAAVPLLRWGAPPGWLQRRVLLLCVTLGCLASGLAWIAGVRHPVSLAVAGLAAVTLATVAAAAVMESARLNDGRPWIAILRLLSRQRRQYAGYLVHIGLVCVAIGVTGSSLGTRRLDVDLAEGDVLDWAGREIQYVRLIQREEPDKLIAEAELRVSRGGRRPVTLMPARHLHLLQNEWTTEVAIHSTWLADFYTILHAGLGEGRIAVTLVENPMIRWIWCGGWVAAAGVAAAAWPSARTRLLTKRKAVTKTNVSVSQPRKAA